MLTRPGLRTGRYRLELDDMYIFPVEVNGTPLAKVVSTLQMAEFLRQDVQFIRLEQRMLETSSDLESEEPTEDIEISQEPNTSQELSDEPFDPIDSSD
jgi:hypothetical protein